MTNVSGNILKSFRNFYQEKFNQWQPTPIHVTLPSLFKNEYFLNVRNYVKNNGEDGIIKKIKVSKIKIKIKIKVSDLFIPLLPTAFDDAV